MLTFDLRRSVAVVAFVSSLAVPGCRTEPQAAREIFVDRATLPPELDALANPRPSASQLSRLAARDPRGRVAVGVIDEGVDYLHPQLLGQIRFHAGNQGAGLDLLGLDRWAHPNLINPTLYALVAQRVVDGRLQGVSGDPLAWIRSAQGTFGNRVVQLVKADPRLQGTLFPQKVLPETVLIFWQKSLVTVGKLYLDGYVSRKQGGGLLTSERREDPAMIRDFGREKIRRILDQPWVQNEAGSGGLEMLGDASSVHGFDAFYDDVMRAFAETDRQSGLTTRLKQYENYLNFINDGSLVLSGDPEEAWFFMRSPLTPMEIPRFLTEVCRAMPAPLRKQLAANSSTRANLASVRAELARKFQVMGEVVDRRLASGTVIATSEQEELRKFKGQLGALLTEFDLVFSQRPDFARFLSCKESTGSVVASDPALRNVAERQRHPFLGGANSGASHGTHVAGIIARQSGKIDIVPIRLVTATTVMVPRTVNAVRVRFEQGFQQWISHPDVQKGLEIGSQVLLGHVVPATSIHAGMAAHLNKAFRSEFLDFYFFQQITQAIQFVGNQKIKIANLSLGTNFVKGVLLPGAGNEEGRMEKFNQFVVYEYFKFAVAAQILKYAPQTLFVIAAGNDGAWLDGRSRSGLPCDLSSPVMAEAQKDRPVTGWVPNNRVQNILCVGSVDDRKVLSSFTNIPLTGIPYVLSTGEAILSTVKVGDCEGAAQETVERIGPAESRSVAVLDLDELTPAYDDLLRKGGFWPDGELATGDAEKDRGLARDRIFSFQLGVTAGVRGAVNQARCLDTRRRPTARLSGTSMATPAVAGFIARQLVAEVNRRGISEEQLWSGPEFAPEKLIQLIREKSPLFGGTSLVKDVSTVMDIRRWSPAGQKKVIGVVRPSELIR